MMPTLLGWGSFGHVEGGPSERGRKVGDVRDAREHPSSPVMFSPKPGIFWSCMGAHAWKIWVLVAGPPPAPARGCILARGAAPPL